MSDGVAFDIEAAKLTARKLLLLCGWSTYEMAYQQLSRIPRQIPLTHSQVNRAQAGKDVLTGKRLPSTRRGNAQAQG